MASSVRLHDPMAPDVAGPAFGFVSQSTAREYRVAMVWSAFDAADGDRYSVEVTDLAGAIVLGLAEESVEYEVSRPNGPRCPPECRRASREGT